MFADTITVFNFQKGVWFPHVICGVDATGIAGGKSATTLNGVTKTDNGIILIQTDKDRAVNVNGEIMSYVSPKAYADLTSGEDSITFQPQLDFIMLGEYKDTDPIVDDNYESGFYDEMNNKFDDVYQIVSATFYSLIPHFEIGVR